MEPDLRSWVRNHQHAFDWQPYENCRPRFGYLILIGSGVLQSAIFGSWALLLFAVPTDWTGWVQLAGMVVTPLVIVVHLTAVKTFRRNFARADLQTLLDHTPRPIVYLRGFGADDEALFLQHTPESRRKPALGLNPVTWSTEEVAVGALSKVCPVVAVGMPTDTMPPVGAARLYTAAEQSWQGLVRTLLSRSALTLLRPARGEGIQWELRELLTPEHRHQCVILLVDAEGLPYNKAEYMGFRDTVLRLSGIELPIAGWNSWLLYFDSDGHAQTIDAQAVDNPPRGLRLAIRALLEAHPLRHAILAASHGRPSVRTVSFRCWCYLWPIALTATIMTAGLVRIDAVKAEQDRHRIPY